MSPAPTMRVEHRLFDCGVRTLAALDEVGRGAIAGPVSVGAVAVSGPCATPPPVGLRDSKLLTATTRERLVEPIRSWVAAWSVGHAQPQEIDAFGIVGALKLAAHRALIGLAVPIDEVLLDGNVDYVTMPADVIPTLPVTGADVSATEPPHSATASFTGRVTTIVKGDRDCASIAAASVLAKVTRDAIMTELDSGFTPYGWKRNKGYGTAEHAAAIGIHGPCKHHRRSWRLPGQRVATHASPGGVDMVLPLPLDGG